MTAQSYTIETIATVHSPFKEKFGVPRQPALCDIASDIVFDSNYCPAGAEAGLEQASHIWLLFMFHQNLQQGWKPMVRPPRLGGNKKLGVYATRSSFRPNGIGMSVVKLSAIRRENDRLILSVTGLDLVDGTPIVDVKPYVPYTDHAADAQFAIAEHPPEQRLNVIFSEKAKQTLHQHRGDLPRLEHELVQLLQQDPRPAYKQNKSDDKLYGLRFYNFNIQWHVKCEECHVVEITDYEN